MKWNYWRPQSLWVGLKDSIQIKNTNCIIADEGNCGARLRDRIFNIVDSPIVVTRRSYIFQVSII